MKTITLKKNRNLVHFKCWANDVALMNEVRENGECLLSGAYDTIGEPGETYQMVGRATIKGKVFQVWTLCTNGVPSSKHHFLTR